MTSSFKEFMKATWSKFELDQRELVGPMRSRVASIQNSYAAQVEAALAEGVRLGLDTAISGPLLDQARIQLSFDVQYVAPGTAPPPGRTWTIFSTSAGLPAQP